MRILLVAVAAALVLVAGLRLYSSATPPTASLTFDESALAVTPEEVTAALGGPLAAADADRIKGLAHHAELTWGRARALLEQRLGR